MNIYFVKYAASEEHTKILIIFSPRHLVSLALICSIF